MVTTGSVHSTQHAEHALYLGGSGGIPHRKILQNQPTEINLVVILSENNITLFIWFH